MDAYAPSSDLVTASVAGGIGITVCLGYAVQAARPAIVWRAVAWVWITSLVAAIHFGFANEGPGFRLLAVLFALFYGIKALVAVEARLTGLPALGVRDWSAFALLWPGMQPAEFGRERQRHRGGSVRDGLLYVLAAVALLFAARGIFAGTGNLHLAGFVFIAAFILGLHIGGFTLLTAAFRGLGYDAQAPFRAPWRSRSLHEFWARRWNIGFSVMTTLAIYRPLVPRLGRRGATFAGFLVSGLIHEAACSLPVDAGYGLPTAYFVLHGIAMACEQWLERRGHRLRGIAARIWVFAWVLLPAPLLFHTPLLEGVIRPLL